MKIELMVAFLNWWDTNVDGYEIDDPCSIASSLKRFEESGMPKAEINSGIRQAFYETLQDAEDIPKNEILIINEKLRKEGLPTLDLIKQSRNKEIKKILKKGKIDNDEEYYIVREYLDSLSLFLRDKDGEKLSKILEDYKN